MKTIITIGVVMAVVILAFSQMEFGTVEVTNPEPEVREVEVTPDWAKDEDAVKAAQAVIRKKELEVNLKALDTQIKELQTQRKAVTDELTTY